MSTHPPGTDELILVRFVDGPVRGDFYSKRSLLGWPPPPEMEQFGDRYVRESFSQITDEQMVGMTHVVRGAAYRYYSPDDPYANADRMEDTEAGVAHNREADFYTQDGA